MQYQLQAYYFCCLGAARIIIYLTMILTTPTILIL